MMRERILVIVLALAAAFIPSCSREVPAKQVFTQIIRRIEASPKASLDDQERVTVTEAAEMQTTSTAAVPVQTFAAEPTQATAAEVAQASAAEPTQAAAVEVAHTSAAEPTQVSTAASTQATLDSKAFALEVYLYDNTRRDVGYTIPKEGFGITVIYSPTDYISMDRIDTSKIQYNPYTVEAGTNTFEVYYEGVKGVCSFESDFYIEDGGFSVEASRYMFDLQNQWREEQGKAPLVWSDFAYEQARIAAKAVGDANDLNHDVSNKAVRAAGYTNNLNIYAENLACGGGYGTVETKLYLEDLIDFSGSTSHHKVAMADWAVCGAVAVYAKNHSLWLSAMYGSETTYANDPTLN
jgi:uncharacterized protein YkwD